MNYNITGNKMRLIIRYDIPTEQLPDHIAMHVDALEVKSLYRQHGDRLVAACVFLPALAGFAYGCHQFPVLNYGYISCAVSMAFSGDAALALSHERLPDAHDLVMEARRRLTRAGKPDTAAARRSLASRMLQRRQLLTFGKSMAAALGVAAVAHGAGMVIEHVCRPDAPVPATTKLQR